MAPSSGRLPRTRQGLYLAIAAVVVLNVVCYRALAPLRSAVLAANDAAAGGARLSRRAHSGDKGHESHDAEESEALINWLRLYMEAAPGAHRIGVFALMTIWLVFLFAFVGICASEFFCPNLSHIASRLGLSESVAGVTFLAFSNGSPDVFSTFSALRSNSGSLAIGELLGAASFITSVVAGTMALITPFRVSRRTFLRDVGFFSIAVTLTLAILYDQYIHLWEALLMVGLYAIYVIYVAIGSWWERRNAEKKRLKADAEGESEEEADLDRIVDGDIEWEGSGHIALPPSGASTPRSEYADRAGSPASTIRRGSRAPLMTPPYSPGMPPMSRSQSQSSVTRVGALRPPPTPLPHTHRRNRSRSVRPSLLGAIEFADVVHSLSSDQSSAANVLAVFGGAHQHHAHSHEVLDNLSEHAHADRSPSSGRRRASSQPGAFELGGDEDVLANGVLREAENRRKAAVPPPAEAGIHDLSRAVDDPWRDARSPLPTIEDDSHSSSAAAVPYILVTSSSDRTAAPSAQRGSSEETLKPLPGKDSSPSPSGRQIGWAVANALFPSLQSFSSKSIVGKVTALVCVPALLALNLTLPVAEEPDCDETCSRAEEKRDDRGSTPADAGEEGEVEDPIERIGRTLHSPATAHGHSHDSSTSHRLQHIRAERTEADAPSPSLAWGEITRDPLEPLNLGSPAVALQQNPLEEFGVVKGHHHGDEAYSPAARGMEQVSLEETESEQERLAREKVTRALTALQCALGPVFVVTALLADDLVWYYPVAALGAGCLFAFLAYRFFTDSRHRGRIILSFLGFAIAMVWILMIVNEVVGVLQTYGHIFGISDAILGLTIFAMGNSLGDLVANATVARMGYPAMAVAACFGGPMLNILLGVGLSGSYLILLGPSRGRPIHVPMSRTLGVSGVGLLAILISTLICVPLNGYRMSKPVGATLIAAYTCLLCVNIAVEIWL